MQISFNKLTDSLRRASVGRPQLDADEGGRADDVAQDDDDRQFDRFDLGPRDALDGAWSRGKGWSPPLGLVSSWESGI